MRRHTLLRCTVSAAVVGAVAFGLAGAAAAQDAQATVDDIIVTAQKREQSLQDVPIVVTSLSSEILEAAGVRDIKDMQILTPGLTVTSTINETSTTARIRGVGTVGDNPGLESSVGVVIDGVYRSRNGVGFGDLGEMSRIEVLKGPQGTLFGKNTSAGVINIITEAPSFTPGFDAELTAGNYGAWGLAASATGPLSDTVAGRLYVATRARDGFYDVRTGAGPRTMTDDQTQDFWTARGQLLIMPSDTASIRLIADYTSRDEYCCAAVQVRTGPTYPIIAALAPDGGQGAPASGFGARPFSRTAYLNRDTNQSVEDMGLSAEVNLDIEGWNATFTSITSWRDWTSTNAMDIDYTSADILHRENNGDFGFGVTNLTQEFRLAGATDRLDWLVGLFATREDMSRQDSYHFGSAYNAFVSRRLTQGIVPPAGVAHGVGCVSTPSASATYIAGCLAGLAPPLGPTHPAAQGVRDTYSQTSNSLAVFTNNTLRLTDQFDLTLGLRYTRDDKRLLGLQNNVNGNGAACASTANNAVAIAGALVALGNTPAAAQAMAARVVGISCLPWTNFAYNNRRIGESFAEDAVSGTFKASYRPNESLMLYASYARGYKGAGYNMDRVQTNTTPDASLYFPAETVDSYEVGFKATLLNRTLLLNATYFDQTFEDFQLNTFLGTAFVVESVPEVSSRGVDMDFVWFTPVEGLSFQGGVTYTDTKYSNFTRNDLSNPARFDQLSLLPGARASFAPEWSVAGAIAFDRSLGHGLRGGFNLAAKYSSEYNTGSDLLPWKQQGAFTLVNGRVSVGSEDGRWTLDLWGQNLTDEEYVQVIFNGPLQGDAFVSTPQPNGTYYDPAADTLTYNAYLGQPRTWGLTLRLRY